jgi:hypothetical protein
MARHRQRIEQTEKHSELLPRKIFEGLLHVPRVDAITSIVGRVWSLQPDGYQGSEEGWPAHLQWGADQLVEIARHLRAGRLVAALVITRRQLERWTLNLAHHFKIEPLDDESDAAYFTRVWAAYPSIDLDVGQAWAELSECLHGRGVVAGAQLWENLAGDVRTNIVEVPSATIDLNRYIADVATTVFTQVRGGVRVLAQQAGRDAWANLMMSSFTIEGSHDLPDVRRVALGPLDLAYAYSGWSDNILSAGRGYRLIVAAAAREDSLRDVPNAHVMGAILERRTRAIERFRVSMKHEEARLGEQVYRPGPLEARLFRYISIAEASELLSEWTDQRQAECLRLAAGALRSAFYLWLEDTDVSMACVRVLLEQTCQARTWRTKPQRAQRLGGSASPARWIDASGWKRARVLGRALGEFSHISLRARISGARQLLEAIQADDVADAERPYTARGNALDAAAYLLAFEVCERLADVDEGLANGFREQVTLIDSDEHLRRTEKLLLRAHDLRSFDFGEPDLGGAHD